MSDSRPPTRETPQADPEMEREEGLASDQAVLPVDHALLLAAVRNEIPDEQARPIFRLVHTSPAWHAAYRQILLAEARAEGQP